MPVPINGTGIIMHAVPPEFAVYTAQLSPLNAGKTCILPNTDSAATFPTLPFARLSAKTLLSENGGIEVLLRINVFPYTYIIFDYICFVK